jgi:small neutral amino acid transporter SnatA (MarC family)
MEYFVVLGGFLVFMVALRMLNAYWQRKHPRTRPPRHQGEPQSQRGRVYKNPPPTNHNADPYSGWH